MISIIIPFHNEEKNLPILYKELLKVLESEQFEIIFVDDGSTDRSPFHVTRITSKDTNSKLISYPKRLGKGQALAAGFKETKGDIIAFMDADLQDNPEDLNNFIKKMNQGYDLINGWRKKRKDKIDKTLPSKILNKFLTKFLFSTELHDINCGFKMMRRQVLEEIPLYGDNYRFIPILA